MQVGVGAGAGGLLVTRFGTGLFVTDDQQTATTARVTIEALLLTYSNAMHLSLYDCSVEVFASTGVLQTVTGYVEFRVADVDGAIVYSSDSVTLPTPLFGISLIRQCVGGLSSARTDDTISPPRNLVSLGLSPLEGRTNGSPAGGYIDIRWFLRMTGVGLSGVFYNEPKIRFHVRRL